MRKITSPAYQRSVKKTLEQARKNVLLQRSLLWKQIAAQREKPVK